MSNEETVNLSSGEARVTLEHFAKEVHCRVGSQQTGHFYATAAAARKGFARLVALHEERGFVRTEPPLDPPRIDPNRIELSMRGGSRWLAVVEDTKLTVTADLRETTMFLGSVEAARARAIELATDKRARGYKDMATLESEAAASMRPARVSWRKTNSNHEELDFLTGMAAGSSVLFVKKGPERDSISVLVLWRDGRITPVCKTDWGIESVCSAPDGKWLALGDNGEVLVIDGEGTVERAEHFACDSTMSSVRLVAGTNYAVGMGRQVMRRDSDGLWSKMTRGLPEDVPGAVTGLRDIAGFSENELYAAGWRGELWRFDGHRWAAIETGTKNILSAILCADDGQVYAVGKDGTVVAGRNSTWRLLPSPGVDWWGAAWFRGALYVSSLNLVYRLEGETFKPTNGGSTYHVVNLGSQLLSIGTHELEVFDGETWQPLPRG